MRKRRHIRRRTVAAVVVAAGALVLSTAAVALPPFTTLAKSSPPGTVKQAQLGSLSVACHASSDRLVFRFGFGVPGYSVRYVSRIIQDPSGKPLPLPGKAKLLIVFRNARAHTSGGGALPIPATVTPGCPSVRKLRKAGDFEGVVSFGAGLDHKTGFRVFRLTNPTRVVIDITH